METEIGKRKSILIFYQWLKNYNLYYLCIHIVRSKNEKVARAIRNVKDNPDVVSRVDLLIS